MYKVVLTFYGELTGLFPDRSQDPVRRTVMCGRRSVKDLIESLGIPHPELGIIEWGGTEISHEQIIENDGSLHVHPFSSPMSWSVREGGRVVFRFICDVHLGKLARRLRLLGFDAAYRSDWADSELANVSVVEKKILLTRDRHLLMRKDVVRGLLLRNMVPDEQVVEILIRLRLVDHCKPFTRCLACNGMLALVARNGTKDVADVVPPKVRRHFSEYHCCNSCRRMFWKGSHHRRLQERIHELMGRIAASV